MFKAVANANLAWIKGLSLLSVIHQGCFQDKGKRETGVQKLQKKV